MKTRNDRDQLVANGDSALDRPVEEITIEDALQRAVRYHNSGDFGYAVELYSQILEASPNHPEAMHLLGVLGSQFGQHEEAVSLISQAIENSPNQPVYHCNLGNVLQAQGKFEEAKQSFQKCLSIDPNMAEAHYNLGCVFEQQDQIEDAIQAYNEAIVANPQHVGAYINLGNTLQGKSKFEEAIQVYQQAIGVDHTVAEAHYNLGCVFEQQDQISDAVEAYQNAIARKPDYIEALNNLGNIHRVLGDLTEANQAYQQVLSINPDVGETLYNLGVIEQKQGQMGKAVEYYQRAVQAGVSFTKAHLNLGYLFKERRELNEAVQIYRHALDIDSSDPEVHMGLASVLLLRGDFEEGWEEYEWRWELESLLPFKRNLIQPFWDGSPLDGKIILLYAEQGFGDAIQFIRYVDLIDNSSTSIIVECQPELVTLFEAMDSINQVIPRGETLPDYDVHAPLLSLPRLLNTDLDTIPNQVPYLSPSILETTILDDPSKLKVGIVWATDSESEVENWLMFASASRSIELLDFAALFDFEACQFYSLQFDSARTDIIIYDLEDKIIDLGGSFDNFDDTRAAIMQLDLVISVDTAVAHLAGALGKPVWTLLPTVADWRWLCDRFDSPWYPTMKLFRQEETGNWDTVIQNVGIELTQLVEKRSLQLSETQVYSMKEAMQLIGISPSTYRNWERRGLVPLVQRNPRNRRRCFTEEDIRHLQGFVNQRRNS